MSTSWTSVRFDHAATTGACSTCHNGTKATGKPANHIPTSNVCDDCHVVTSWANARFDHNGVTATCSTCHNGAQATGKPANHISTSAQCDSCHSTLAWTPARFDHANVSGSCSTCHNGTQATGKPTNHFSTSLQCDECHATSTWTPLTFRHSSADYPGDHRGNLTCRSCHTTNAQAVTWTTPAYQPDCAGCHANDFRSDPHKKWESPTTVRYTVSELRDCSGACHIYTNSSMTQIKETRNSEHRVNDAGFD
ncbi:MAG: hypothetical protein IV086_03895 [Hyphomonadaceae bacterium]|nr:hypothetical protein [Hyphomonadaceae bacterium]